MGDGTLAAEGPGPWTFRLDEAGPGRVRVRAETRAVFPGPAGGLYRLLVIGTGAHVKLTRRLLTSIRRHAEHPLTGPGSGSAPKVGCGPCAPVRRQPFTSAELRANFRDR